MRRPTTATSQPLLPLLLLLLSLSLPLLLVEGAGGVSDNNNSSLAAAIAEAEAAETAAAAGASSGRLRRGRRFLDFTRGTRMSWRTNVKNNVIKVNTLWAHAYGFRFNYPFPDKADRRRPFFKRDVLRVLEESLDAHGLDGRACVLKSYCSARLEADGDLGGGMLFKLLRMLFSLEPHELRRFPFLQMDNCRQILHSHCPLSFNSISPFTDDV